MLRRGVRWLLCEHRLQGMEIVLLVTCISPCTCGGATTATTYPTTHLA